MNNDFAGLEQMLEKATAPSDAPQESDAKRDEYREAWLAFGRLLEAAQPAAAPSLEQLRLPRTSHRWPLAAAALAASLLIGLSVYWAWNGASTPERVLPAADQMASAKVAKAASAQTPAASTSGDLRWDDSLDQQLTEARQQIALAQSDLAYAFDAADSVRYRLKQAQQDIEDNKL